MIGHSQGGKKYVLEMFKHLLKDVNDFDPDWQKKGVLRRFAQQSFIPYSVFKEDGLEPFGFIFYPFQCADGRVTCRIHI